jgi:hypothetical protein
VGIIPGSPEWHARKNAMLADEATQPMRWWYLSFAEPGAFRGGIFIEARGGTHAIMATHALGINPGGQVVMLPIAEEGMDRFNAVVPEEMRSRLLTREELAQIDLVKYPVGTAD